MEPPPEDKPPPPPAVPPAGWNSGVHPGGIVLASPTPRVGATLNAAVQGPLLTDGSRVFVAFPGSFVALAPEGAVSWSEPLETGGGGALAADGSVVSVGARDGILYSFDPVTGTVAGKQGAGGPAIVGEVRPDGKYWTWVDAAGRVHSSAGWDTDTGLRNARGLAVDTGVAFVSGDADPNASKASAVFAGEVAAAPPDSAWHVVSADRNGVRWRAALSGPPFGAPALDLGHVYVAVAPNGRNPGGVDAFTREGLRAWTYRSDFGASASLCVVGDTVVLPDRDGKLYGLSAKDGHKLWDLEGFGPWVVQPVAFGKMLLAANADGTVHAVDLDDGGTRWTMNAGSALVQPPVMVGRRLILLGVNDRLTIWEFE
jgi:outer membrane protein assembly factor BamB